MLWSKVEVFVYGRSLSLSVINNKYQKKNLVGPWKSLLLSGDLVSLPSLKRLIYVSIEVLHSIDLFSELKEYLPREHCLVHFGVVYYLLFEM